MARRRNAGPAGAVVPLAVGATMVFNPLGVRDVAVTWYSERVQERTERQLELLEQQQQERLDQLPTAPAPASP